MSKPTIERVDLLEQPLQAAQHRLSLTWGERQELVMRHPHPDQRVDVRVRVGQLSFTPFTSTGVQRERDDLTPGQAEFIAELRHWREVTGHSQKALARAVGYTASYVSKIESGTVTPSEEFASKADQVMQAGRAIVRRWWGDTTG